MVLTQRKIAERGGGLSAAALIFMGRGPETESNAESAITQHRDYGSHFHACIHQYPVP